VNRLAYAAIWVLETLLRFFPVPCRTGLRAVGAPGPEAPVFLTGNYHLTVSRLKWSLRGLNCWLLVADSGGINVWCAAAGGRLTDHSVISALKTSGIEQRVRHRRVVLPQLVAAGIRAHRVQQRSGWCCVWGPVYAEDIPEFLRREGDPDPRLREVRFPWPQRLEMALAWAFPLGLISTLILLFLYPQGVASFLGLAYGVPLLVFLGFPLYAQRPVRKRRGLPLLFWGFLGAALACMIVLLPLHGGFALLLVLLLAADLRGSTPIYGGGILAERGCRVVLRRDLCRGSRECVRVCPRGCFASLPGGVVLRRPERCLRCSACIVQCPADALCFRDAGGRIISPEQIRGHKLGLSGRRTVRTGGL
jgi:ferredoxin